MTADGSPHKTPPNVIPSRNPAAARLALRENGGNVHGYLAVQTTAQEPSSILLTTTYAPETTSQITLLASRTLPPNNAREPLRHWGMTNERGGSATAKESIPLEEGLQDHQYGTRRWTVISSPKLTANILLHHVRLDPSKPSPWSMQVSEPSERHACSSLVLEVNSTVHLAGMRRPYPTVYWRLRDNGYMASVLRMGIYTVSSSPCNDGALETMYFAHDLQDFPRIIRTTCRHSSIFGLDWTKCSATTKDNMATEEHFIISTHHGSGLPAGVRSGVHCIEDCCIEVKGILVYHTVVSNMLLHEPSTSMPKRHRQAILD